VSSTLQLDDDDSNDVEVTWTDQEKINQFSRLNTRQTEAEGQLKLKRQEKEQIDEVYEEIEMLELNADDDEDDLDSSEGVEEDEGDQSGEKKKHGDSIKVVAGRSLPFKIGDAFVYVTLEKGIKLLDQERQRLEDEIAVYEKEISACEQGMKGLKVDLYAKFGSNISECKAF